MRTLTTTSLLTGALLLTAAVAQEMDHAELLADSKRRNQLGNEPAFDLVLDERPEWKRIGPPHTQPNETFAVAVASHPENSEHLVAGFRPQGIYRSIDGGTTWQRIPGNPKTNGDIGVNSESLGFSPHDPSKLFIGYEETGVFWSHDFGETVTSASEGLKNKNVITRAFDPKVPDRILIGTDDGMHISRDGGITWRHTHGPDSGLPRRQKKEDHPTCSSLAFDPFDSSIVYTSFLDVNPEDEAGVYISRDGGKTWQASNRGLKTGFTKPDPAYPFKIHAEAGGAIRPSPIQEGVVYLATVLQGLWKSTDHGRQWTCLSDPAVGGDRGVTALALHPANPDIIAMGDGLGLVYLTRDGGKSWTPLANGLRVGREAGSRDVGISFTTNDGEKLQLSGISREFINKIDALSFSPDGKRLFAAASAGLYVVGFEE